MHTVTDPNLLSEALAEHPDECVCLEPKPGGPRLVYRPGWRLPMLFSSSSSTPATPATPAAASSAQPRTPPAGRPSRPRGR